MERLDNPVRDYAWGSTTAIPELLGRPADGRPQAELWVGAHPDAPSRVLGDHGPLALDEAVARDPLGLLGEAVARRFDGRFPFLLKILAAAKALSLQVHPDSETAARRYAEERASAVGGDAMACNYRDTNPKPEMVFALTPFHALCGFRPPSEVLALLEGLAVPALAPLRDALAGDDAAGALRAAMTWLLSREPTEAAELAAAAAAACRGRREAAARTLLDLAAQYPGDVGVVASLLLNRVTLSPGQALYLPAGNVHAYLEGVAVEIMASSDNVLRGGLTAKKVDVPELLSVVRFVADGVPWCLPRAGGRGELVFAPPTEFFALSVHELGEDPVQVPVRGPQLLLALDGQARLSTRYGVLTLERGGSALVRAGEGPLTLAGHGRLIRGSCPVA